MLWKLDLGVKIIQKSEKAKAMLVAVSESSLQQNSSQMGPCGRN